MWMMMTYHTWRTTEEMQTETRRTAMVSLWKPLKIVIVTKRSLRRP